MEWDKEADVVIVGFGGAGAAAAITAHDLGAKVLMLEKAPEGEEGGNTRDRRPGLSADLRRRQGDHVSQCAVRALRCAADDGARVGGGSEPEQRLGHEHRRRSAGAPAPARRHRVSGAARRGLRAQVPQRRHPRLLEYVEVLRIGGEAPADRDPLRDAGPRADPGRHHQGDPRRARRTARQADPRESAQGRRADLRRLREQPGDDPELSAGSALLLHLGHARTTTATASGWRRRSARTCGT